MLWCDKTMLHTLGRSQLLLGDVAWFGGACAIALVLGIIGDQLFRSPPLGLRYRSSTERILATPAALDAGAATFNVVGTEEVEALLADPNVITLDARPRVFYEISHLPGALSLSREQFEKDIRLIETTLREPGRTLLVYCSDPSCEDGARVCRALQERGFKSLHLYHGGFDEWEAAGMPVESAQ